MKWLAVFALLLVVQAADFERPATPFFRFGFGRAATPKHLEPKHISSDNDGDVLSMPLSEFISGKKASEVFTMNECVRRFPAKPLSDMECNAAMSMAGLLFKISAKTYVSDAELYTAFDWFFGDLSEDLAIQTQQLTMATNMFLDTVDHSFGDVCDTLAKLQDMMAGPRGRKSPTVADEELNHFAIEVMISILWRAMDTPHDTTYISQGLQVSKRLTNPCDSRKNPFLSQDHTAGRVRMQELHRAMARSIRCPPQTSKSNLCANLYNKQPCKSDSMRNKVFWCHSPENQAEFSDLPASPLTCAVGNVNSKVCATSGDYFCAIPAECTSRLFHTTPACSAETLVWTAGRRRPNRQIVVKKVTGIRIPSSVDKVLWLCAPPNSDSDSYESLKMRVSDCHDAETCPKLPITKAKTLVRHSAISGPRKTVKFE